MIREVSARPPVGADTPFGAWLDAPFGRPVGDAWNALEHAGGEGGSLSVQGVRLLALDTSSSPAIQHLGTIVGPTEPGSAPVTTLAEGTYVFASGDATFLEGLAAALEPLPEESALLVATSATGIVSGTLRVGSSVAARIAEVFAPEQSPALQQGLAGLPQQIRRDRMLALAADGVLADATAEEIDGAMAYFGVFQAAYVAVRALIDQLPDTETLSSYENDLSSELRGALTAWMGRTLDADLQRALISGDASNLRDRILDTPLPSIDLDDFVAPLIDTLVGKIGPLVDALPAADWVTAYLMETLAKAYDGNPVLQMAGAMARFQADLASQLTSTGTLSSILGDNAATLFANQQQVSELAAGAVMIGQPALVVGTIYGILYDIVNTFVQVIYYSFIGIRWVYRSLKTQVLGPPEDEVPASDAEVNGLFPAFDIATFLQKDAPAVFDMLMTMSKNVHTDFVANAEQYARDLAGYIASGFGGVSAAALKLLFEPYPASGTLLDRLWYVVRQWFQVGALLGPMVVDALLFFCSAGSSGYLSAAVKLGRIEKLGEAIRFTRLTEDLVTALSVYRRLDRLLPEELLPIINRVFEQVWNAVGAVKDQILDRLRPLLPAGAGEDTLEQIATAIDLWYDRCSTLNTFVAVCILISGEGDVDQQGAVALADA